MKIIDNRTSNVVKFENLKVGECFESAGCFYIKTSRSEREEKSNAFCFIENIQGYICSNVTVKPIKVELTILE